MVSIRFVNIFTYFAVGFPPSLPSPTFGLLLRARANNEGNEGFIVWAGLLTYVVFVQSVVHSDRDQYARGKYGNNRQAFHF